MNYNPYDLFPLLAGNSVIYGRVIELDSEIVNQRKTTNAFGILVKPKVVVATCPGCGDPLQLTLTDVPDPPFKPVKIHCESCYPPPPPPPDPFVNPIEAGRITLMDLDPLIASFDTPIANDGKTVLERLAERSDGGSFIMPLEPSVIVNSDLSLLGPGIEPSKDETTDIVNKYVGLDEAEGIDSNEADFDDLDDDDNEVDELINGHDDENLDDLVEDQ